MTDNLFSLRPDEKPRPKSQHRGTKVAFASANGLIILIIGAAVGSIYLPRTPDPIERPGPAPHPSATPAPAPPVVAEKVPKKQSPQTPASPPKDLVKASKPAPTANGNQPTGPANSPPPVVEPPPLALLESRGLVRSDSGFVLREEARCAELVGNANQTFKQGDEVVRNLKYVDNFDKQVEAGRLDLRNADTLVNDAANLVQFYSRPINNFDHDNLRAANALLLYRQDYRNEMQRNFNGMLAQGPNPTQRKELNDAKQRLEGSYVKQIAELRKVIDSTKTKYDALARDERVASALRNLRAPLPSPSQRFLDCDKELTEGEAYIKKMKEPK